MNKLSNDYKIVYRYTQIDEDMNTYIDIIFITKDGINFYETQLPSIAHQNAIYPKILVPNYFRYSLTGVLQRNDDYQGWIEEYGKEIISEGQSIEHVNGYLYNLETMFDKLMMIGCFKLNGDLINIIRTRLINVIIDYPHFKQYFQYQEN